MGVTMNFDSDDFERAAIEAARGQAEEMILNAARDAQQEMGPEGESLAFTFEHSDPGTGDFGKLVVTGGDDAARQKFQSLLHERMKP